MKDIKEMNHYLHIVIINNEKTVNDNKNIAGKMFLLEKGQNSEFFVARRLGK